MEFKILKKNKDNDEYNSVDDETTDREINNEDKVKCELQVKAKEGLEQILNK